MKIGVNGRTFSVSEPGGAVQSALRLTTELIENTDHEVVLFGSDSLSDRFDVSVRSTGFHENQLWGVCWERAVLPRLVTISDIDVLYCPNGNAPLHNITTPVVMCIHDINAQKGMSSGVHRVYRQVTLPPASRNCDAIVTVSDFSRREITQRFEVDLDSVHVIYNGIDKYYLSESSSEPPDLPEDYILYVGAMNPRKNVNRLIRAYESIHKQIPHKLVLIGPQNKSVFKDMDINHFSQDIITPGFVPRKQLKYAYEHASIFAYPSLYEGFGLPPLEAMACGTPVVASDIDCFSEVLGNSALLVDPYRIDSISEGITQLLENDERAEMFRRRGKDRVKQFTWEKTRERLVNVFRQIVE
ncbi:glycosyltransferase family 1 protein [Haloarcula hispanica]|uniref:Glycosyltransferase family 1 protein n=1 Tax=Haloarcula hispanica TaxID=51589 RepID=A0A5J5LKP5_HALHI|nr:glycosyltransferase family 1 protein [Haloarcula hispanica]KAA9409943.1 glycosyltransferase family 1 protein [Haloarcula hispanica]